MNENNREENQAVLIPEFVLCEMLRVSTFPSNIKTLAQAEGHQLFVELITTENSLRADVKILINRQAMDPPSFVPPKYLSTSELLQPTLNITANRIPNTGMMEIVAGGFINNIKLSRKAAAFYLLEKFSRAFRHALRNDILLLGGGEQAMLENIEVSDPMPMQRFASLAGFNDPLCGTDSIFVEGKSRLLYCETTESRGVIQSSIRLLDAKGEEVNGRHQHNVVADIAFLTAFCEPFEDAWKAKEVSLVYGRYMGQELHKAQDLETLVEIIGRARRMAAMGRVNPIDIDLDTPSQLLSGLMFNREIPGVRENYIDIPLLANPDIKFYLKTKRRMFQ
ncbi:MAG: hypothetical protein ACOYK8_00870 [Alphaproteobacteria bacterium]